MPIRCRGAGSTAAALEAEHVATVCCDRAQALAGPFTTGPIARNSFERILDSTLVEPAPAATLDHFTEAERQGRLVPDQHPDEHATCYVVQGRILFSNGSMGGCLTLSDVRRFRVPAFSACSVGTGWGQLSTERLR